MKTTPKPNATKNNNGELVGPLPPPPFPDGEGVGVLGSDEDMTAELRACDNVCYKRCCETPRFKRVLDKMLYSHMALTFRWQATGEEMGDNFKLQRNGLKKAIRVPEGKIEWGGNRKVD